MSGDDRLRWDQIYRERAEESYPPPDPLLFEFTPPVPADDTHRALDIPCGLGQNGVWLASQGYLVDMVDVSRVALLRAQEVMGERGLRNGNLYQHDLDTYEIPADTYELVCVFRYLKRDMFPQLRQSVRSGGRIMYETFNRNYEKVVPGFNPAFLLEIGELAGYFADWKILHTVESGHTSSVVAVKP